jgi:hypothetical protein
VCPVQEPFSLVEKTFAAAKDFCLLLKLKRKNCPLNRSPIISLTMVLGRTPAGQWEERVDMAGPALFLGSPASDLIHGMVLSVDGWLAAMVK